MKTPLLPLAIVATSFLTVASLHAQIISVDWGGDYVSSNQGFGQGAFNTYRFNDTNANDSTIPVGDQRQRVLLGQTNTTSGYFRPTSGYTAPSGKTSNFFMGTALQYTSGSAADPNVFRVGEHGTADTIRLRPQGGLVSAYAFLGFAQADFLNGTDVGPRGLDATTSIAVTFGSDFANTGGAAGTPTFRYGVLNAGQWYLSNTSFTNTASTTFTLSSSGTETWGSFDPLGTGAGSSLAGTGIKVAPSSFSSQSFNDVQGFGVWASGGFDLDLAGFSASTVAVPEPSSLALIGLSLGAFAFFRRRVA